MSSTINTFEDLKCWQACRSLRLFIAKEVVPSFHSDERFRLKDQLLRSARSTTANIAEGFGRYHHLDNAKFCSNARASCWEVLDHLITGNDENVVSDNLLSKGRELITTCVKILNGYISYLQKISKPSKKSVPGKPTTNN